MDKPKYLLVNTNVLPDVFFKVVQAKKLIAQGKAKSSSEAAKLAGISRSAFYKYKDSVYPYDNRLSERMVTFNTTLEDEPGVLSALLTQLYQVGANIITVNQNISARINAEDIDEDQLIEIVRHQRGVVDVRKI